MKLELHNYQNRHSFKSKMARVTWNIVWLLLFRPTPRGFFYGWRRFLLRLFGAKIGKGVHVLPSCRVWQPWKLTMGDYSCLSENVQCYTVDSITIGSSATVSQRSFLCTGSHDISSKSMELISAPIIIKDFAWVAAECFVGPGVVVGEGAVVSARAVAIKDVPPWTVVAGNPSVPIMQRVLLDEGQ